MSDQLKITLIADMIASRKMKERGQTQVILQSILDSVNDRYKENIETDFTITLGDEFQGMVTSVKKAFYFVDLITLQLQLMTKRETGEEIQLRWGIGIGKLATPVQDNGYSIGMDGPAFWQAREAVESVRKHNDYGRLNEKMVTGTEDEQFYNSIIRIQNVIRNEWTTTQKETAYSVLKAFHYNEWTNQEVKDVLNADLNESFSDQTISKRIISTNIKQYTSSRQWLAKHIEEWRMTHDN